MMDIKIFAVSPNDYWAAETADSAWDDFVKQEQHEPEAYADFKADGFPWEVPDESLDDFTLIDEDTRERRTWRQQLALDISEKNTFPMAFAISGI